MVSSPAKLRCTQVRSQFIQALLHKVTSSATGGCMLHHSILCAGEFFGGGDETAAAAQNGSLQKLLKAKGAL